MPPRKSSSALHLYLRHNTVSQRAQITLSNIYWLHFTTFLGFAIRLVHNSLLFSVMQVFLAEQCGPQERGSAAASTWAQ